MDGLSNLQSFIDGLGFPIVCAVGLGYFIYKVWKAQREDNTKQMENMAERCQKREDKLFAQIDKFSETLDKFNFTLTRIDTRISVLEDVINDAIKQKIIKPKSLSGDEKEDYHDRSN